MNDHPVPRPGEKFQKTVSARTSLFSLGLAELWEYRDMLYFLVLRDFKIRFKQSLLGVGWALIQPLVMMLVFTFVFNRALKVDFDGPYPVFFLCGFIPWQYFQKVASGGSTCLVSETQLIRKVYFPRLVLPLAQAFSALSDVAISLVILLGIMLHFGAPPTRLILIFPLYLVFCMLFALSLSLWLGPINVWFRDVQIVMPLFLWILFIVSPIAYPADKLGNAWGGLLALNPMCGIISGFRYCFLGYGTPFALRDMLSLAMVLLLFIGGLVFFNASQRKFADVI